jgi:glycosyltransferase involved in cell wall biosynthesis
MNLAPYFAHPMHSTSPSKPFIFMDASVNKNPGTLIKAFALAFGNRSDVRLVARAGLIYTEMRAILNEMINKYGLTNVVIMDGFVNGKQWIDLLASCDCYVNLSRGEGFSFIPREALALGIPAIITDNTAMTTICASGHVRAIPCRRRSPPNPLYQVLFPGQNCGEQFDCEAEDVAEGMKDVFENYEKYINKAREGRKWVEQYNVSNPELQKLYHTLIKPKTIVLGSNNEIVDGTLTTNSPRLFQKYLQISENWRNESVDQEESLDNRKHLYKWIRFKWEQHPHVPFRERD